MFHHRQYLENEGFGFGSPAERQRQYQKIRAMRAADSVREREIEKLTAQYEDRIATRDRKRAKKQITQNAMERLVEDLISESMAKGEFDNLQGKGEPLKHRTDHNPFGDFTSHKMNEILVEGGFAPEWILLQKDVQDEKARVRRVLEMRRERLGPLPLPEKEREIWESECERLERDEIRNLNKMIDQFNLVVPMMNAQMFHVPWRKICEDVLKNGK